MGWVGDLPPTGPDLVFSRRFRGDTVIETGGHQESIRHLVNPFASPFGPMGRARREHQGVGTVVDAPRSCTKQGQACKDGGSVAFLECRTL